MSNLLKRTLTPDDCTLIVDDAHTIFDLPSTSMLSEDLAYQRVLLRPKVYPPRKVLEPLIMVTTPTIEEVKPFAGPIVKIERTL